SSAETGLVHVRTIYTADGENLYRPVGIGADDNGGFFVTLRDSQRVVEFDRGGDFVRIWGEQGLEPGQMMVPLGVDVDRLSGHVYVTDRSRFRLMAYDLQGDYLWEVPILNPVAPVVTGEGVAVVTFGPVALFDFEGQLIRETGARGHESGQFDYPRSAAALGAKELVVADSNNTRVQRVSLDGEETATAAWVTGSPPRFQDDPETLFGVPSGVAVDDEGRAFVLDGFRHKIAVLNVETGEIIHTFADLEGQANGRLYLPTGIAFLGDSTFAVTDTFNDRVQIIRLLLPEENTVTARTPWLWWLLPPALVLPPFAVLLRRRSYATGEALDRAAADDNLRLVAGALKTIGVLPEVKERFADMTEGDVRIGEFLVAVDTSEVEQDRLSTLAEASRPRVRTFSSLGRRIVLVLDEAQAEQIVGHGVRRVMTYDELIEQYSLDV
ncbi:MAG: NHL repeat-containing protein, partial [Coriobacteriia bacterium]